MKSAWRITTSRAAKFLLLWLFKKRISGLLPLIMLLDLGRKKAAKSFQSYFSWFERCFFFIFWSPVSNNNVYTFDKTISKKCDENLYHSLDVYFL